jgi:hypothetical protein
VSILEFNFHLRIGGKCGQVDKKVEKYQNKRLFGTILEEEEPYFKRICSKKLI